MRLKKLSPQPLVETRKEAICRTRTDDLQITNLSIFPVMSGFLKDLCLIGVQWRRLFFAKKFLSESALCFSIFAK